MHKNSSGSHAYRILMGQPIWFSPWVTRVVYSDANSFRYGDHHKVEVRLEVAHGQWSEYEASLSSTWRELNSVSLVLYALGVRYQHV